MFANTEEVEEGVPGMKTVECHMFVDYIPFDGARKRRSYIFFDPFIVRAETDLEAVNTVLGWVRSAFPSATISTIRCGEETYKSQRIVYDSPVVLVGGE